MKLVLPLIRLAIAFCSLISVLVSTPLVASSRIRNLGSEAIILAIVMASASTGNFYSKAESDENEEIVRLEKST